MKGADGIVQGYNAQAGAEPELLLIVGQAVTETVNDKQQPVPMVELVEQQSGQRPEAVLASTWFSKSALWRGLQGEESILRSPTFGAVELRDYLRF